MVTSQSHRKFLYEMCHKNISKCPKAAKDHAATKKNKAFIDIRLCPGIAKPLHASPYGPLWPNVTSSIKQEVHKVF